MSRKKACQQSQNFQLEKPVVQVRLLRKLFTVADGPAPAEVETITRTATVNVVVNETKFLQQVKATLNKPPNFLFASG